MAFTRIKSIITKMVALEQSPRKFAFTCALGIYIGISPLVGLHTAMVFACGWLFALHIPVLLGVSMMIHNPWTMMPVYAFDHIFGKWLFMLFDIDALAWDPTWMEGINLFFKQHTGISGLSLSAFFIGGNILAIGASLITYPLMKYIFIKYAARNKSEIEYQGIVSITVRPPVAHSIEWIAREKGSDNSKQKNNSVEI